MPGFEVIGEEEKRAVDEVFDTGGVLYRYGFDAKRNGIYRVDRFEERFAEKMGVTYALAVSSGTAALKAALKAMDIGPGDEVITQSHTFIATVEAIVEVGATPVITEIDRSLNMDPSDLSLKITKKTRAVIPVHMMGVSARMGEILKIAKESDLLVLEDNAQCCGGTYRGKMLGTLGDIGITSFDFGKVLTTGEGGMIYTNHEELFKKAREYSDHGHELNPNVPRGEDTRRIIGFNYKMTEIQGAIGLVQLSKMDSIIQRQVENKKQIKDGISDIKEIEFRDIPNPDGDTGDSVVFFLSNKDLAAKFVKMWTERGFGTKNLPDAINWHFAGTWDHILSVYPQYSGLNLTEIFQQSNALLRRAIAIPIMVNMDGQMIGSIIDNIHECVRMAQ